MKTYIISIRKLTALAIFVSLVFLYLTPCYAKKVTLKWSASPGAAGYKFHYKTGNPGPPFNGTGATKNISPTVINSPVDIGASTQATIHLPEGAYHFALTAYNKYGESEITTVYSTCKFQKVNAATNLCTSLLSGYSNVLSNPDQYHLNSLVRSAEAEFENFWEEADVCPTASMEYVGDIIFLAVEDMVQQISDGVDLESQGGRKLGELLLKAIQEECVRSFENGAYDTFQTHWNWYINFSWQWGVTYSGPPCSDIADMIDDLVKDVLAEIL